MSKKYHIVQSRKHDRLENKVNEMIEEGWIPCGGLNVLRCWKFGFVYSQAMMLNQVIQDFIKKENNNE